MSLQILLVEDELKLAQYLELELQAEGYSVNICSDGMSGLIEARELKPDLAILDWNLPHISGPEICRRLRQTGDKIPIILLTAKDSVHDRVMGLDSGADDYLTKPFRVEELLARVRTRLRGVLGHKKQVYMYSNLTLKKSSREVLINDKTLELSAKEFDLLAYFLENPQQAISKAQILNDVWQNSNSKNFNLVQVYVSILRSKLEQYDTRRLIHTIRGFGYILR